MKDTVYRGVKTATGFAVTADGRPFTAAASQRHGFHAQGFSWGYAGGGSIQLAHALLLDVTGDPVRADKYRNWFLWHSLMCWGDEWEITAERIRGLVADFAGESDRQPRPCGAPASTEPAIVEGGVA